MRAAALALLLAPPVLVAGCAEMADRTRAALSLLSDGSPAAAREATARGLRTMSLFDGAVRVRGPEGYCVDAGASSARTGFTVLAACARVSEAPLLPDLDGLLTVQIGEPGSAVVAGNEATLAALLAEEAGRAMLSDSGGATAVQVHETVSEAGLVVVRFADGGARAMEGTEGPGWRAFLDVAGRSAVISLRPFTAVPLTAARGEALIRAAAAALRAANPPG